MKKSDTFYIERAISIAIANIENKGGPFGAVIVKDNKIIAESGNSVTTELDPTAHAEINAIRKACKTLNTHLLEGCAIYSSCEPCPMCLSAIYWAKISTIYYAAGRYDAENAGFQDNFIYKELALPNNNKSIQIIKLDTKNYNIPFEKWNLLNDKTAY